MILIHDKKVSNLHAVVKVLELALKVCVCFHKIVVYCGGATDFLAITGQHLALHRSKGLC